MASRSFAYTLSIAALSLAMAGIRAQNAAQWQARQLEASRKSEAIMKDANHHKGLLAQYLVMRDAYLRDSGPAFHVIFGQYLSWYQSFIGDYPGAATSFSISQPAQRDDRPSPVGNKAYTAEPAVEAIPRLARNARAVFFNEAHNIPLTRTLTVQLLGRLREQGFNYFAAETLYQSDVRNLATRGYPVGNSGFYTNEPVCAEMVRTALKLGFKVVAYEALSDATGDAREKEQAHNLYQAVFARDPKARLVVDAGYAHIQESGEFLGGSSMAVHLRDISGIDPLTVEQTMLIPHQDAHDDHPDYTAFATAMRPARPTVFVDGSGRPWSLRPGYDVSVFFPPQVVRRGRPTWLDLGGLRQPFVVNATTCRQDYPCLVEAQYTGEGEDAIPADRLMFDPVRMHSESSFRFDTPKTESSAELYLRPGTYTLRFLNAANRLLLRQQIEVKARPAASDQDAGSSSAR